MKISEKRKYVVLDVETNGLSSIRDDLLSISIYKPDDKKTYNRFLPLELSDRITTTSINGIRKKDLKNAKELSQKEVDVLFQEFELDKRIILTYGSLDEKFIKNYFKRKHLIGFERMTFYNFKHNIISSAFGEGNVTKDNLCQIYKMRGVNAVHSGLNDCFLEWKLFEKLDGKKLLIIENEVYEFNDEYIIPISYLSSYPNFKYHITELPKLMYEENELYSLIIEDERIERFPTNFNGIIIEHLLNCMTNVEKINSIEFLAKNKSKLQHIGTLPSFRKIVSMIGNKDGSFTAVDEKDKELEKSINQSQQAIKEKILPLIEYLLENIFMDEKIYSQELVVNSDANILALCDLSCEHAILEIKTYMPKKMDNLLYQLYYQSNGRKTYLLKIEWISSQKINFIISEIVIKKK